MSNALLDADAAGCPQLYVRCPVCGIRLSPSGPTCPTHGAAFVTSAQAEKKPEEEQGIAGDVPIDFPIVQGYVGIRWIARGGFGLVLEARRESDGKRVAIKIALTEEPDAAPRLFKELQALKAIGPPTVPEVFGSGVLANGAPYIIMELLLAKTLADKLADQAGPTPLATAMPFVRSLLEAAQVVEERGFVHADLKPENIFWRDDDSATLIDFGLVVFAKSDTSDSSSAPGTYTIGTSEYMSPEQCQGAKALDVRTDVYALGVLVYEILSGRPPFLGASEVVRQNHLSHRPPRLSTLVPVPPIVEDVILQCLQKRPEERFQSIADLRVALERAFCQFAGAAAAVEESVYSRAGQSRPCPSTNRIPQPTSGVPSSKPVASTRKKIRAVLAFFESSADAATIERHLLSLGGELASVTGHRAVALFGNGCEGNPARLALLGARELIKRKICTKARLDIASVAVQTRPNGARRLVSPIFAQLYRFPTNEDPLGPTLSPAVTEVLNEADVRSIVQGPATVLTVRCVAPETPTLAEADETDLCFGREVLLHHLVESAMDVVRRGTPTAIRVLGDEGLGKTHIVGVLSRRITLAARGVRVISIAGRSSAMGEGVLADLLRAALVVPSTPPPDGGKEWFAAQADPGHPNTWPAAALALGFLHVDAPELSALITAPSALRSAMIIAAGSLLRASARRSPLLVLFDDAHLADEATLSALEFATLAEARAPLWVLALGRPSFETSRPHWGERAERNETYHLGPLDADSAAKLCRKLLLPATAVPDAAIQRLVARAQAVPMLLVELVRGLKREGIVRVRAEGHSHYLATEEIDRLPDLPIVEWLADRELSSLSDDLAAHARLLAVLADEISTGEIEGILRQIDEFGDTAEFPLDAYAGTQRLVSLGVLWASNTATVRFRHPLVREAIAKSLPEASRRRIHALALEYYRSADLHFPRELLLSRLACHAAGAGELGFAELALVSLAECAASRQRYLDAEIHYTRSLALAPSPSFSTYRSRGLMRARLGRHRDSIADFEAALALIDADESPLAFAEVLLDEAEALDWVDDYGASAACVDRAEAILSSGNISQLGHRLLLGKGRSLHRRCLEPEAAAQLELAVIAAEERGDNAYETLIVSLLMLGFILQGLDKLDRAAAYLDRAITLCEQHGDLFYLGAALSNRALLRALVGDKQGMVEGVRRVATIARELGQVLLELASAFNLGEYLFWMNDLKGAEPHIEQAFAIERRRAGAAMLPSVELLRARFEHYIGNRAAAAEIVMGLRARQAEAIEKGGGESFLSPSDDILCSMIELSTHPMNDTAWDALEARSARYSVGQEQIEVLETRGLTALAEGRVEEACFRLERALALADRIPNCMRERLEKRLAEARGQTSLRCWSVTEGEGASRSSLV